MDGWYKWGWPRPPDQSGASLPVGDAAASRVVPISQQPCWERSDYHAASVTALAMALPTESRRRLSGQFGVPMQAGGRAAYAGILGEYVAVPPRSGTDINQSGRSIDRRLVRMSIWLRAVRRNAENHPGKRRPTMPDTTVLDSYIHYQDVGQGEPSCCSTATLSSSYLWRNVIPELSGSGRCLAPDLIGMGRSGKPDIAYRFADHARYLDAWFDALELDGVTLVGHDWGGALGFDWAARHPDRVNGVAFMETIVRPGTWDDWPAQARELFQAFRRPGEGEAMILDQNLFIEALVPGSVLRTLSSEELDTYRAPFTEREHRKPILAWVREIPIDGQPADVAAARQRLRGMAGKVDGGPRSCSSRSIPARA